MSKQHQQTVPPLDAVTVDFMDRLFPERSPDPRESEREIWMKAGERRAAVRLLNLFQKQEQQNVHFRGL